MGGSCAAGEFGSEDNSGRDAVEEDDPGVISPQFLREAVLSD